MTPAIGVLTAEQIEAIAQRGYERGFAEARKLMLEEAKPSKNVSTVSVKEAAAELKCSTKWVRKLVAEGRLKASKLKPGRAIPGQKKSTGSSRLLILRSSIEALLKESAL